MEFILEKIIIFSRSKVGKLFFNIFENLLCKTLLFNKNNLYNNIINYFQLFSNGKIFSNFRKKKYLFIDRLSNNNSTNSKIVNEININSYCFLGKVNLDIINEGKEFFLNQNYIYNSHVPLDKNQSRPKVKLEDFYSKEESSYGSFDIKTSVNCYALLNISKTFNFKNIADNYLMSNKSYVYSINTMITKNSKFYDGVCNLHRDSDSMSSLTFFIYWTKTEKDNGATIIYPGSHCFDPDKNFKKYSNKSSNLKYLFGESGSIFAVDTWAWHSGNKNIKTNRLVTWVRFTACPANTYFTDRNYLFKDELKDFNNRLIYN
jgi:hypothetical protein